MSYYKLTDNEMRTYGNSQWELGVTRDVSDQGSFLFCSSTALHGYASPTLAVMMNPIHADIQNPRCFEIAEELPYTDGLKRGGQKMTLTREVPLPAITLRQRVIFAILIAWRDDLPPVWRDWAMDYVADRIPNYASLAAAAAAADAAEAVAYAARAAYDARVAYAADAAYAAAAAAEAVADAARAAYDARAAYAAAAAAAAAAADAARAAYDARVAYAAAAAAEAVADAARAADEVNWSIRFEAFASWSADMAMMMR